MNARHWPVSEPEADVVIDSRRRVGIQHHADQVQAFARRQPGQLGGSETVLAQA